MVDWTRPGSRAALAVPMAAALLSISSLGAGEWEAAEPGALAMDPERLQAAVRWLEANSGPDGVDQLVIVRRGRLVHRGPRAHEAHGVWSVTKSFTSSVLGLLVDEGRCHLDDAAAKYVPELAPHYSGATLRHFTTMTSGYRARGDEPRGSYLHGPSPTPFEPASVPLFAPGSHYAYWDSAMNQLANVLTRIAGEPVEALFRRRVAGPIGMNPDRWDWGSFDRTDAPAVNGGAGNHGQHVRISALELARLGQLFLQRGEWDGKQLLSTAWVDAATRVQVPASIPWGQPESGIDGRGVYGFNWWVNASKADGSPKWPGVPAGAFAASGYNNNDCFVIPEWDLVVVRLGLDESSLEISDETHARFLSMLGESLRDDPLRSSGEAWRLEYPRVEIAPRAWRDESILTLAGRGPEAVHGRWTRRFPLESGKWYRFTTSYRSERVDEPLRSVLARVLWRSEDDSQIGRAEYPATRGGTREGWSEVSQTYRAPPGCVAADVELVYRWDGDGVAEFRRAVLEEVPDPGPRRVRLASVHHRPRGSAGPRQNLESFAKLVARAAAKRADIVCLPEGVTMVGTAKNYVEVAEPIPGPSTEFLGAVSEKHGIYIVAGIYEREGAAVYNTAVLLDPGGKLAGKYRKVCLPREEIEGGITPGTEFPVFETRFGRVGMMICWDVFFPEPARELSRHGAEVIFLPIWGGNVTLARARAIENQVYLVSSTYDMKTAVFDREGEIIAEGSDDDPVIVVEVDLNSRKLWPWLGDLRARIRREEPPSRALGS